MIPIYNTSSRVTVLVLNATFNNISAIDIRQSKKNSKKIIFFAFPNNI
jgi:hypothetical protein